MPLGQLLVCMFSGVDRWSCELILCLSGFSGGNGLLICHKSIVILMVGVVVDFDWGLLRPMDVEEVLRP